MYKGKEVFMAKIWKRKNLTRNKVILHNIFYIFLSFVFCFGGLGLVALGVFKMIPIVLAIVFGMIAFIFGIIMLEKY